MAPLARLAIEQGFKVSGSDAASGPRLADLERAGARVFVGHDEGAMAVSSPCTPDVVVRSSAISDANPEVVAARRLNVPVLDRRRWLPHATRGFDLVVAVAGTHGKTTTTSALAQLAMRLAGVRATAIVGGVVDAFSHPELGLQLPGGARRAPGEVRVLVIEADEYGGMFLGLEPDVVVLTALGWDHADQIRSPEAMMDMFKDFCRRIRRNGTLCFCSDCAKCAQVVQATLEGREDVEAVAFGQNDAGTSETRHAFVVKSHGADEHAPSARSQTFVVHDSLNADLGRLETSMLGSHNRTNLLGAVVGAAAVARAAAAARPRPPAHTRGLRALASEVLARTADVVAPRRRLEILAASSGRDARAQRVVVVDDYAHHPTEIAAAIAATRERFPHAFLLAVVQPHTFSRVDAFRDDFCAVLASAVGPSGGGDGAVWVLDVFPAREKRDVSPAEAAQQLARDVAARAPVPAGVTYVGGVSQAASLVRQLCSRAMRGDDTGPAAALGTLVVLVMGAGDVTQVARAAAAEVRE
ncbi:unnamed protein product [Pedinophyceae sp. YPF-701]|nr:unnamed protein product [Pedinophyceae sp. YPF-701]